MREHSAAVMRYMAALAKRMGLEISELSALAHVQGADPMTLGRLGGLLSMSPGAVTMLVDRLEKRGYVERLANPEDRRSLLVRATDVGLEESLRNLRPYVEDLRSVEESFSEEERTVIARFLAAATETTHRHAVK